MNLHRWVLRRNQRISSLSRSSELFHAVPLNEKLFLTCIRFHSAPYHFTAGHSNFGGVITAW